MMLSCTNLQENEVIPTGLTTDTQELLFSEASEMKSIVVVSGSRWSVDEKPSWLSIQSVDSQRYSEYEWTVNLASEANAGYDREGMLTILAGSEEVNISVEQEGKKGKYVAVESVSISPSTLTLTEGESSTLTYTISPSNASEKGVTWKSSSPSVATVSESGEVEALTVGTTTIMITTEDGGKTSSCAVTVKAKVIPVKSVSLDKTSITMTVGDTQTLIATVAPENATEKSVTWSSSNTSVATVSPYGVVTAKAAGTATIVVTTIDGSKKADCALTVKSKEIPVESISLDRTRLVMKLGESRTLTATVSPSSATEKGVTWTSDNSSVATVSTSGVVTAKGYGSATIRAKTIDGGYVADCSVEVYTPIQDLDISMPTKLTITEGEIEFLHVSINVDIEDVHIDPLLEHYSQWSVEDESIVSIDRENSSSLSALLKAISVGTTKVTNKLMDSFGSRTLSCLITVEKKAVPVTGVSLNKSSLSMTVGDTQTLTATVTPSNATDKTVTWTSSKTTVASVSSSGVVTAKAAGTATITVTTNDGSKTATCTVTVTEATVSVTGVSLDKTSLSLIIGNTQLLTANVIPENATDKSVVWSSSNTNVATVSSSGLVTAKKVGTAIITVSTNDGAKTATCSISVEYAIPVAVDLGLSVKWASFNIGAAKPEDTGYYYPWGETDPVAYNYGDFFFFGLDTYKWYNSPDRTLTKYCPVANYGHNGYTDNKSILDQNDDAAYVILGPMWRMPTNDEFTQLKERCTWKWTSGNGVNGYRVTGPNGNSIFLPAAGFGTMMEFRNGGTQGYYWSSSLRTDYPYYAYSFSFGASSYDNESRDRSAILPIRPVSGAPSIAVTGVSLNQTSLTMTVGDIRTLTATVIPSNATDKSVTWSSSNTSVATVSSSGVVTAKAAGKATITVTTNDGRKVATCQVSIPNTEPIDDEDPEHDWD